jgi:hypothetical protein
MGALLSVASATDRVKHAELSTMLPTRDELARIHEEATTARFRECREVVSRKIGTRMHNAGRYGKEAWPTNIALDLRPGMSACSCLTKAELNLLVDALQVNGILAEVWRPAVETSFADTGPELRIHW